MLKAISALESSGLVTDVSCGKTDRLCPLHSAGRAGPSCPGPTGGGGVPFSNLPKGAQEILHISARSCWGNLLGVLQRLGQEKGTVRVEPWCHVNNSDSIEPFLFPSAGVDTACDQARKNRSMSPGHSFCSSLGAPPPWVAM